MENIDPILGALLGAVLLLFGRRLFWFFVAVAGFVAGRQFAGEMLGPESAQMAWLIGLAGGVVGAIAGIFLQKLAIAAAGFLVGGYLTLELLRMSGVIGPVGWIGFVAGGLVGAILMAVLFRWTLIVLSAVLGAALVAQALPLTHTFRTACFLVLAAVGVLVQGRSKAER